MLRDPALRVLLAVCLALTAVEVGLFGLSRDLSWDEAVYFAELLPSIPSAGYSPTRSQGMLWMGAPVAAFAHSPFAVRSYLFVVHAALWFFAFAPWTRVFGTRAALGPLVFLTVWPAMYYSTLLLPNLAAALLLLGVLGLAHVGGPSPGRGAWLGLAAASTAVVVLRPTEATVALGLFTLIFAREGGTRSKALALGIALGVLAWVAEAVLRFDGVGPRLAEAAAHVNQATLRNSGLWAHLLAYEHTRAFGEPRVTSTPWPTIALWSAWVVVAAVGAWRMARDVRTRDLALAGTLTAAVIALFFFLRVTLIAPRFLLPAFAMLVPLVLAAIPEVVWTRWSGRIPALAVLTGLLGFSASLAVEAHTKADKELSDVGDVARALAEHTRGLPRCAVASEFGTPQLVFFSGCEPLDFDKSAQTVEERPGVPRFLATRTEVLATTPNLAEFSPLDADTPGTWILRTDAP
ncbi:MAG: hypothetical protein EP330_29190 [Deltaproteobacteria bacterium]|nr:MAG: hypothetical protein EP330_29190 [Deltaproteobacteria bacterium]